MFSSSVIVNKTPEVAAPGPMIAVGSIAMNEANVFESDGEDDDDDDVLID